MISVLIAGKRSDHIRYRLHFWSALPAKRDERMRFEVLELDDEDLFQPGNEKVRLPQPVPPVDI